MTLVYNDTEVFSPFHDVTEFDSAQNVYQRIVRECILDAVGAVCCQLCPFGRTIASDTL
jgi:hypothetical protein